MFGGERCIPKERDRYNHVFFGIGSCVVSVSLSPLDGGEEGLKIMGKIQKTENQKKRLSVIYTESGHPVIWFDGTMNMLMRRAEDVEQ